jgi:protein MAK16
MHNDETIWHCINNDFCSFRVKLTQPKQNFCKNKHNVTGLCNRVSCPLANSQYATVLEEEGVCWLYMKTVERAHSPKNLWERVKLSKNYLQALEQISKELEYWPDHVINRCKQRLTKMRQMLIRMRKISMRTSQRLVPIKKKMERRERTREAKAETAAKVDLAIEKELLERLKQGTYGDIYNFPQKQFDSLLEKETGEEEDEKDDAEEEFVEDLSDDEEEFEDEVRQEVEFEGEGPDDVEDLEAMAVAAKRRRKGGKSRPKVEIEYEEETGTGMDTR